MVVFDSQSQSNENQEKSVSSADLNFESQHTNKTTTPTIAKEICSNMVENLVSSAPLDHQNISSDGGGQKFRETEAIENENLLESQRDLEQNDITLDVSKTI